MDWQKNSKPTTSEWRSVTPEREFGPIAQSKQLVTEPAENKATTKSLSQENNSNKNSINRLFQQYEQKNSLLSKPLTHMKSSIQKLSEIGQQINSIISQCKQHSISRISRPQSDQQMYEKYSMMKKTSQNDISASTNINANHSYIENRGTETERSYLYYKIKRESQKAQKQLQQKDQNKSLKQLIEKRTTFAKSVSEQFVNPQMNQQQIDNDMFQKYMKLIQKKNHERSSNIQKYLNLKFLRHSSGGWSNKKSDAGQNQSCNQPATNNKRMSSYYTQNHISNSQSSFVIERENSKSENATSRNNRVRVSSYIKTPTKSKELIKQLSPRFISQQLSSYQVSSSKINSLLSSMNHQEFEKIQALNMQNLQLYHLNSNPLFIQNDPNQTHVIVCCQDQSIKIVNLFSGRVAILGKHKRPIKALSRIHIQENFKSFYTGSQDGEIQHWISDSMHGNYKLLRAWKLNESPLQIYITEMGVLNILTANYLHQITSIKNKVINLRGFVRCIVETSRHLLIGIENIIYRVNGDKIEKLIELNNQIKNMIYEDGNIFVLTQEGIVILLSDEKQIKYLDEINCQAQHIYNMPQGQILIQANDNELLVYKNQFIKQFSIEGKITCLQTQHQILLIGSNKKIIETIKL